MFFSPPDLSTICLWMFFPQWDISATDELAHDLSDVCYRLDSNIILQMFEGASQYTGGRSIILVEVQLSACCMLGTSFFLRYNCC